MMRTRPISFVLLCAAFLFILQACGPAPTPAPLPTEAPTLPPVSPTEEVPPTEAPTLEPTPIPEPTEMPVPPNGQIVFRYGANLWRYLVDSGTLIQITFDGIPGDYSNMYDKAEFSPDGAVLAYTRGESSFMTDFTSGALMDMTAYGKFIKWNGVGRQFFTTLGDMTCPPVENLEDQALLNFNVMRYDQANLSGATNLGNIGGGLKFVSTISNDGQWLVANHCGCYSECGSENLWHLPTLSQISSPLSFPIGGLDFSPDSTHLVLGQWQMFGYQESALYTAGSDLSSPTAIYYLAGTAPIRQEWSPDGARIAFTLARIDPAEMSITERMVIITSANGHEQQLVDSGTAEFLAWSPDSSRLLYSLESGGARAVFMYDIETGVKTLLHFNIDDYSNSAVDWGSLSAGDLGL
ncbi:MAG TPA: hypothetical protein PLF02_02030 [Anaerolineaceae bacterium]|nr:hypothetical protein [Anaerolineaceae bacterium]